MGFVIVFAVVLLAVLSASARFADVVNGTIPAVKVPKMNADGTPRKARIKKADMTPAEKKEALRVRAAKAAKDRKNLAYDNASAALERREDLRSVGEGMSTLRRFDREAAVYGDAEREAEMVERLRARIVRVTQRAAVAREYGGRSQDSIGRIERLFDRVGGRILDALDAGECMSDAEVDAEVDSVLTPDVRAEILTLCDKAADPFLAFRRKTGTVEDEDAIPDTTEADDGEDGEDSAE